MRTLIILFLSLLLMSGCVMTTSGVDKRGITGHLLQDATTHKCYYAEWVEGDIYWLHEILPYQKGILYYKGE